MAKKITQKNALPSTQRKRINLGRIADSDIGLEERIQDFKEAVLSPFVNFFIRANIAALIVLGVLALVDTILIVSGYNIERVVTEKVMIAAIAAIAVQTAAIIIAAFKGLFGAPKK